MNDMSQAGLVLQGLSAGLQGRGAEFGESLARRDSYAQQGQAAQQKEQRLQSEADQKLELARQKTVFTDSAAALSMGEDNRWDLVAKFGMNRLKMTKYFPGVDFKATERMVNMAMMAASGDVDAQQSLLSELRDNVRMGIEAKIPEMLKDADVSDAGQVFFNGPNGLEARDVAGFRSKSPDPVAAALAARNTDLRAGALELANKTEDRQANKLSATLEKVLLDSQDRVVVGQRNANQYEMLISNIDTAMGDDGGGVVTSFNEFLKKSLGTQDDATEFRRGFNKVRISEGLKSLPPGPASDVDVQMAFKGVPPDNAPPSQMKSFLRGAARLSRLESAYNQFKSDHISENRTSTGINKVWRSSVKSPVLDRDISIAEIYETAQNRGLTPEDVRRQLGVE